MQRPLRMCVSILIVLGLAASASAQDWLVSPAPAVPLHVPIAPPPPATPPPGPATPGPRTGASSPSVAPSRGVTGSGNGIQAPPPLPSLPLAPLAWNGAPRMTAPPVVAFPHIPITWLLGF